MLTSYRRFRAARLLAATLSTLALGVGLAVGTPGTAAADSAPLVGVGSPIQIMRDDGSSVICTLGFAATAPDGSHTGITAGHCGGPGQTVLDLAGNRVGTITAAQHPPEGDGGIVLDSNAPDWAAITFLPDARVEPANHQLQPRFVGQAHPGDKVCSQGLHSGFRCGTVLEVRPDWVVTDISSGPGDSGGPLVRWSDGAALGVLSQGSAPDFGSLNLPEGIDLGSIYINTAINDMMLTVFPLGFYPAEIYSQYFSLESALRIAGGYRLATA